MSENIIDALFDENNRDNITLYSENGEAVEFDFLDTKANDGHNVPSFEVPTNFQSFEDTFISPYYDDLSKIIDLISISKKTITNIKENLFWAFFYNVLMIPIAIGFFKSFGISMSPMIAGLGMTLSSLFVVFNALRLKRIKKEKI